MGKEALVDFDQLIPTFQRMTISSMRCANKVATEAAARMRAAEEQATQDSVAGVSSPAATDKQTATLNVTGGRGHPRSASSSADSAGGGILMDIIS